MNFSELWIGIGRMLRLAEFSSLMGIVGTVSADDVEALYEAAGDGDAAKVSALLDGEVDVNERTSDGSYALNNVAVENDVEIMRILLERGADPIERGVRR